MNDPDEGVDTHGVITTGVGVRPIPKLFRDVIDDSINVLVALLDTNLHSIYVYGSVATGLAVPGQSDLDLVLVVSDPLAATQISSDVTTSLAEVAAATNTVRSIGAEIIPHAELLADTPAGRIERCFLHHYCDSVWGQDLRGITIECTASTELARGFAASLLRQLPAVTAGDWTTVIDPGAFGRRLLMAAAMALSLQSGTWSTDRATAVALITQNDEQAGAVAAAVWSWADSQGPAFGVVPADHRRQLVQLATWVQDAYERLSPK